MNNNYLIPANSKSGQLILNMFKIGDLIILGIGALITLIFLFVFTGDSILFIVIKLLPVTISLLLVMPIPHYHNVLTFLREVYIFYTSQNQYRWRGWCATHGFED